MKVLFVTSFLFLFKISFSQSNTDSTGIMGMDPFNARLQTYIGKGLNKFSAASDKGIVYNNDSLLGKVTLINFWFEGCEPCVAEFDELSAICEQFSKNKNFQFLAFTFETEEAVKRIRTRYNLKYNIIPVSQGLCYALNFKGGFPLNIITNPSGKITHINVGGFIEKPKIKDYFDTAIIPEINKLLSRSNL